VYQGRRGHPIAIPRPLCDTLLTLAPTRTLKDGLAALNPKVVLLDVTDAGVLRDVDVPDDLGEALR
jgi:CTP:molybdopterin cytidylyltransferase MocA